MMREFAENGEGFLTLFSENKKVSTVNNKRDICYWTIFLNGHILIKIWG